MRLIRPVAVGALVLMLASPHATATDDPGVPKSDNVTPLAHIEYFGGTEIDFDGRYAYAGQFNGRFDRNELPDQGGVYVIDMLGDRRTPKFSVVGKLDCPGTDNYVRWLDPNVYNVDPSGKSKRPVRREFIAVAFHKNDCATEALADDTNTLPYSGGYNGVMIVDVTNKRNPVMVSAIGHKSAHTVMPHPTEPYLYILPGGLANGTDTSDGTVSPTGIVDLSDPLNPRYVRAFTHNATGCHDFGFTADGAYGYCAGLGEIQVWDLADVENPRVVGTVVNPAIQFPHNVVVSPDGSYMAINDEAFAFHTCDGNEAADLYGSLWLYDIINPTLPLLAGRIPPPASRPSVGTLPGWVESWCAAHNYNFVPGTDIIVASWFTGGMTAHDVSDPLNPDLIAYYQPQDGVAWSAHYYGGYVVTNDMARGFEVLDVPELRAADQSSGTGGTSPGRGGGRIDRTALLVPAILPERPARPATRDGGFCVLPGRAP